MNETSQRVPAPTVDAQAKPAAVVVRYHYADGILLEGDTGPHADAIEKAGPRWRWSRSLRKWGIPRTRGRMMSSDQVERYARGLIVAGVPHVRLQFHDPKPEDVRGFDDALEERKARALDRAQRVEERADLLEGAEDARRRVDDAERDAAPHEKPCVVLRRMFELAREGRELQVRITGEVPNGWRGRTPDGPATGGWLERLLAAAAANGRKTAHCRQVLDQAGYMPGSESVLCKGDRVITDKGRATVQKVRSQYVELRFDRAVRWANGPQYVLRIVYSRVWVAKATVEQHQGSGPSPERSVPEVSSAVAAGSRSPLATMVAKHRDPKRYTVLQIIDALAEAERLGVGSKLVQYFRATRREVDVERAYGRARAIVAFERDGRLWSPPLEQFDGVEGRDHQAACEQEEAAQDDDVACWPDPEAFEILAAVASRQLFGQDGAQGDMGSFADEARKALAALMVRRILGAKDATRHDPEPEPKTVDVVPFEADAPVAQTIVEDASGVELHREGEEAPEPCGGKSTLETLVEDAARRAEEWEQWERPQVLRKSDARELMQVYREAASRGEVTKRRFNAAFRRLHPGQVLPRSPRSLTVTRQGGKLEALIRGPKGWVYGVELPVETDEQVALVALLRQVEQDAGEAGTIEACSPPAKRSKRALEVGVEVLAKSDGNGDTVLDGNEIDAVPVQDEILVSRSGEQEAVPTVRPGLAEIEVEEWTWGTTDMRKLRAAVGICSRGAVLLWAHGPRVFGSTNHYGRSRYIAVPRAISCDFATPWSSHRTRRFAAVEGARSDRLVDSGGFAPTTGPRRPFAPRPAPERCRRGRALRQQSEARPSSTRTGTTWFCPDRGR
ncbi:hypothetical protein [Paraliomyxa miuraensis]|uniref:hypothetical protein n=1 Tax=Paraliomyxa miuraensis TaxID=376150 RepID=UPI00225A2025|nr:hypothetical protein [Paraliomyxa miuraensis]MCX4239089.1 hypothetical protein [Paraliomyxa miuraensis]